MEPFSATRMQNLMGYATYIHSLGRNGSFTSGCLRRGGAQHRFMYSHEKWSLEAIKWWGRWSKDVLDEKVIRYLSGGHSRSVQYFGDMHSPVKIAGSYAATKGFTGNILAVTKQDMKDAHDRLKIELIQEMSGIESRLLSAINSLRNDIVSLLHHNPDPPTQSSELPSTQHLIQQSDKEAREHCNTPVPRIPTIKSWEQAIQQWDEGDVSRGLTTPLSK